MALKHCTFFRMCVAASRTSTPIPHPTDRATPSASGILSPAMLNLPMVDHVPRTQPLTPDAPSPRGPRPDWLRVRLATGKNFQELRSLLREQKLHTICEEALCPNMGECWENRTATFLILG